MLLLVCKTRGGPRVHEGMKFQIEIDGVGLVPAKVAQIRARGAALALQPDEEQRRRIMAKLHTKPGRHGMLNIDVGGIAGGFWRRKIRRIP